jgi:hypothetical protein
MDRSTLTGLNCNELIIIIPSCPVRHFDALAAPLTFAGDPTTQQRTVHVGI